MTATSARVTAPPVGLLEALGERYDGGPFTLVSRLEGGYANDVFLLASGAGPVVARVKYPPSDAESIAWEHDVVARIGRVVPEAVAPVAARDGSTFFFHGTDAAWIVPYVDGEPTSRSDEAHRAAAARLLGRLHAATARIDVAPRVGVEGLAELRTLDVAPLPAEWRERVAVQQRAAVRFLDELESLPRVVVHGDFFPGNVLTRGGEVAGLVDWEEAHVAPPVVELASAAWEFTKSTDADDYDRGAAERFVRAYRDAGGPGHDAELIRPLIHAKRVLEVLRAPSDRRVDWAYQEHNLRSAEKLA